MGKFERMAKRRELKEQRRKIRAGEETTEARKQQENKMKTWRKDQQGNIIFGGWLKISRTALVGLRAIVVIGVLFAVAVITNTETAGECKNPFCEFFGIDDAGHPDTFAPPTSGMSEERVLP